MYHHLFLLLCTILDCSTEDNYIVVLNAVTLPESPGEFMDSIKLWVPTVEN